MPAGRNTVWTEKAGDEKKNGHKFKIEDRRMRRGAF
jgi:hypothetical protein